MTDAAAGADSHLVVIDPQRIFADPASPWASPFFESALANIRALADQHRGRTTVTRWLPTAARDGSWADYFAAWPFADVPADDPLYELVEGAADLTTAPTVDLPTFGKWGPELAARVGAARRVVLAGVSTDCCVISTALAAADAGARVTVVTDACAPSTAADGAAAEQVMALYAPQVVCMTAAEWTDSAGAAYS